MAQSLSARIGIRVHARAKHTGVAGKLGTVYKINIASPALDGKANEACKAYIAKIIGVHHSRVNIVLGLTNPSKIVEVERISQEQLDQSMRQAYESR